MSEKALNFSLFDFISFKNTRRDKLLQQVQNVGDAKIIPGAAQEISQMGAQQIPKVQREALALFLQIFTRNL
jgi:hypothetical protein